jgi:outer membrane protein TolC
MFSNRLDYLNEKERLEDSDRSLAIARDALRGSLGLDLGYDVVSDAEATFADQRPEGHTWSAGLVYDLPLDRLAERNAYRAAEIAHTRSLRDFDEFQDTLVVDLRTRFRSLERIEQSLDIQRESIRDEERNLVIAQLLFDRGENSNRDVVEAQESLLEAQNSLVREQVNYEIERLNLLRDMGILFIDELGMWTE